MTTPDVLVAVPLLSILAFASMIDLQYRRIPNALSLGGAVIGLAAQAELLGPSGVAVGAAGWAVCLVSFLPFYISGAMAGGDVKLMAAAGAFLGPLHGFAACLLTLVAGAVIAFLCLCWLRVMDVLGRGIHATKRDTASVPLHSSYKLDTKIPYAGAIAIGTTIVVVRPALLTTLLATGAWA
jgi:prepilin peptidase CpaA